MSNDAQTPKLTLGDVEALNSPFTFGQPATVRVGLEVSCPILFDPNVAIIISKAGTDEVVYRGQSKLDGLPMSWLPPGSYEVDWLVPRINLAAGEYLLRAVVLGLSDRKQTPLAEKGLVFHVVGEGETGEQPKAQWYIETTRGIPVDQLAWKGGHDNWFYRHFDHAAWVVIQYMLNDAPELSGKILDVGCGDGITDLGIALRTNPELLVGIDPFSAFERLDDVLREAQLDLDMPDNLVFQAADGNHIPYPDDYFDVVISWGSVEHIAGGYLQTLREIKRVLKDGGLLFIHPGLYYGNYGHHLGEFCEEPFFHLTRSKEEIRDIVFSEST